MALDCLQLVGLLLIPVLVATTPLLVLGSVYTTYPIIYELRGIVAKCSDAPLALLLISSTLRFVASPAWRSSIRETLVGLVHVRTNLAWVVLVLWMIVGASLSREPILAGGQAVWTGLALFVSVLIADRFRIGHGRLVMTGFALAVLLQSVITIMQSLHNGSLGLAWLGEGTFVDHRGQGLTFNPNTISSYLMVGVFVTFLVLDGNHRDRVSRLAPLAIAVVVCGLFATQSRAAMLGAGVGLLVLWIGRRAYGCHSSPKVRWLVAGTVAFVGMLSFSPYLVQRLRDPYSIASRILFAYRGTLTVLESHPIRGVGAGNLMIELDRLAAANLVEVSGLLSHGLLQPAHNAYLTLWAELGLPGIALYAVGCWPFVVRARCQHGGVRLALSCALLALSIQMCFEYQFWLDVHWRMIFFWLIGSWWGCTLHSRDVCAASRA